MPTISPASISLDEFTDLLARYRPLVRSIQASKGAKKGQRSLEELDRYRYVEAPDKFGSDDATADMGLEDVKTLVEWKLRHGKFRPALMSLVSSNPPDRVSSTVQEAVAGYRSSSSSVAETLAKTLSALSTLRGIGPATASLLLAVHDPSRVIFFSDEAFWWLCRDGQRSPIRYAPREYAQLAECAGNLMAGLGVSAIDLEMVAYVIMRSGEDGGAGSAAPEPRESAAKSAPKKGKTGASESEKQTEVSVSAESTPSRSEPSAAGRAGKGKAKSSAKRSAGQPEEPRRSKRTRDKASKA